jgi:hypothetical protein
MADVTKAGSPPGVLVPVKYVRAAMLGEAALNLGQVYRRLGRADRALGEWALPTHRNPTTGERILDRQLDLPTKMVFGEKHPFSARLERYDRYCDTIIPELQRSALGWAVMTLAIQADALQDLRRQVAMAGFADWMHQVAPGIAKDVAECEQKARDAHQAQVRSGITRYPAHPAVTSWQCLFRATDRFLEWEDISRETEARDTPKEKYDYVPPPRPAYVELLRILRVHRGFGDVIAAYARSGADGTKATMQLIAQAAGAVDEFAHTLVKSPASVWRYPPLIIGAVEDLKLSDYDGFQEFALAIAHVIGDRSTGPFLTFVGMALLGIGLLSGVGTGLVLADLALGGAGVYFSYVRDHERELAFKASSFLPDQERFAKEYGYGTTVIAGAFLLLVALNSVRAIAAAPPRPTPGRAPSPPAPAGKAGTPAQTPPSPTAPAQTAPAAAPAVPKDTAPMPPRGTTPVPGKAATPPETPGARPPKAVDPEASPGAPGDAQKGLDGRAAAPKTGEPVTPPQRSMPGRIPEPADVPIREVRRRALEQELEALKKKMADAMKHNDAIGRQIAKKNAEKAQAARLGKTKEVETLEEEIERLKDEYLKSSIVDGVTPDGLKVFKNPDAERYKTILDLLRGTERDYYKALTNAARGQPSYRAVQNGATHPMFKPLAEASEVEHLWPRNTIWNRAGFEKLTWDQQVFLFAWRKNLMRVAKRFNGRRGTIPYSLLKSDIYGEYIDDAWRSAAGRSGVDELSRLELEAAADIEAMIRNPKLIDAMADNPTLLDAVSGSPRLRDTLSQNPGLIDAMRKDPTALDRIMASLGP